MHNLYYRFWSPQRISKKYHRQSDAAISSACHRVRSLSPNQSEEFDQSSLCENSDDNTAFYSVASHCPANVELAQYSELNNNSIITDDNDFTEDNFKKSRKSVAYQSVNAKHFSFLINKPKSLKFKCSTEVELLKIVGTLNVPQKEKEIKKTWTNCFIGGRKYKHICGAKIPVSPLSPAYDYATLNLEDKKKLENQSPKAISNSHVSTAATAATTTSTITSQIHSAQKVWSRRAKSADRIKTKTKENLCVECGFEIHADTVTIKGCALHRECFKCSR